MRDVKQKVGVYSVFVVLSLIAVLSFAIAAYQSHIISSTSVAEDVTKAYNISINNTEVQAQNNITSIRIQLPASFIFLAGSNSSSTWSSASTFANTSTLLNWTNISGLVPANATGATFMFNATASTPGFFNISVLGGNGTNNTFNIQNLQITINDTTAASAVSVSTPLSRANISSNNTFTNITITDNGVADVYLNLTNSSGQRSFTRATSTSSTAYNATLNITAVADGFYNITVYANDTGNNLNNTFSIQIARDQTPPTVSLNCDTTGVKVGELITCSCTGTDETSGLATANSAVFPDTSQVGSFSTSCIMSDSAGNVGTSNSVSYSVSKNTGSSSGGSSSSSSSTSTGWTSTVDADNQRLEVVGSVVQNLGVNSRVLINVGGEAHHVGVKSISSSSATIEIASTPQQATLTVGQTMKFDIDSDGYYDIAVKLNSITNGKANVTVTYIHEIVNAPAQTSDSSSPSSTTTDSSTPETTSAEAESSSSIMWWIIAIVIVVIIVVMVSNRKKSHPHHY